jgi:hypothetical protein
MRAASLVELSPEQISEMERLARLRTLPARATHWSTRTIAAAGISESRRAAHLAGSRPEAAG